MTSRMPFIRPSMPPVDVLQADLAAIVESNWYTNFGPVERAFRDDIAGFVDESLSVATVSNATAGLMAALAALLPRGDGEGYIATPSFTFVAAAQVAVWHGYRPAWFDIDADTLQPSLASFERLHATRPEIRAILLTNTFGIANEQISDWEGLAKHLDIPLVIDSAPGFGSQYADGERLGGRGDAEVFSFHATKALSVGEAGAVTTRDPELAERIRQFTNFGFAGPDGAAALGLNGKLQEITAAIGRRQLARFDEALRERRSTFRIYAEGLQGLPVSFPAGTERSALCFAPMVVETSKQRDRLLESLHDAGVEARAYYAPPVHRHPALAGFAPEVDLATTDATSARMVSLPVLSHMTTDEAQRVVGAIRRTY